MSDGRWSQRRTLLTSLLRDGHERRHYFALKAPLSSQFQTSPFTMPDRYPAHFNRLQELLADGDDVRLVSFGCSTGEEVIALRERFPRAWIRGIDVNPLCVLACRRRWWWRQVRARRFDRRTSFACRGTLSSEPTGSVDAVVAMAVFRHGALFSDPPLASCGHLISFAEFERAIADIARSLRPNGLLVLENANFRFADTASAVAFDVVGRAHHEPYDLRCPLFGPNNHWLDVPSYDDVIFQKRSTTSAGMVSAGSG